MGLGMRGGGAGNKKEAIVGQEGNIKWGVRGKRSEAKELRLHSGQDLNLKQQVSSCLLLFCIVSVIIINACSFFTTNRQQIGIPVDLLLCFHCVYSQRKLNQRTFRMRFNMISLLKLMPGHILGALYVGSPCLLFPVIRSS